MKPRVFREGSMREALEAVKQTLGPDAIILSTRRVRPKSKNGLYLDKTEVEITACHNPSDKTKDKDKDKDKGRDRGRDRDKHKDKHEEQEANAFEAVVDDPISIVSDQPANQPANQPAHSESLASDLSTIRDTLAGLEARVNTLPSLLAKEIETLPPVPGLDNAGKRRYGWFLTHGVEEPIARQLAMMEHSGKSGKGGLKSALKKLLKFRDPLKGDKRVIALVGPTGVGKTTTLAKMAAELILNRRRSVGMITLDTFRVGAVAQLETYAKMLQVRLVVARTPAELKAGIHALARCETILIDTVGSSPYNQQQVTSTGGLLKAMGEERDVILCMAGNVRETEQRAVFQRFSVLKPSGILFTKLDETVAFGGILNVALRARLPLTLYTDGQRVPENLNWLSVEAITHWFERNDKTTLS